MTASHEQIVQRYLDRLERALTGVPHEKGREILGEIETHIHEELTQLGHEPAEHEILEILDRVGDPGVIASEAHEGHPRPARGGALEIAALILLLIGGFVLPFIGWIIGVVLLWVSPVWNTRDKWIGTLVVPGGLAGAFYFLFFTPSTSSCSVGTHFRVLPSGRTKQINGPTICESSGFEPWLSTLIIAALALAAIWTTIYLARRMRGVSVT